MSDESFEFVGDTKSAESSVIDITTDGLEHEGKPERCPSCKQKVPTNLVARTEKSWKSTAEMCAVLLTIALLILLCRGVL